MAYIATESQLNLLPCPFCGSEAHYDSVGVHHFTEKRVYAPACTECSCELMNGPVKNYAGSGWYETKEAAAADWNNRTVAKGGAACTMQNLTNESLNQLIAIESLANDNAHEERRTVDQIYHAGIVAALEELRERREASVKAGDEWLDTIGYYPKIDQLISGLIHHHIQQSTITSIEEMAAEIKRIGEMCASSIKAAA